jgi:hypothetical protein
MANKMFLFFNRIIEEFYFFDKEPAQQRGPGNIVCWTILSIHTAPLWLSCTHRCNKGILGRGTTFSDLLRVRAHWPSSCFRASQCQWDLAGLNCSIWAKTNWATQFVQFSSTQLSYTVLSWSNLASYQLSIEIWACPIELNPISKLSLSNWASCTALSSNWASCHLIAIQKKRSIMIAIIIKQCSETPLLFVCNLPDILGIFDIHRYMHGLWWIVKVKIAGSDIQPS